ncbi:MAG: biopolymer transporter ExbD [Bacteroidetes bacterium]|nr:biopolymer transporter ExbD [Bacteroidota bacterium]
MDEPLVDIVLILLAALVAVAVIPTFSIELPESHEIDETTLVLKPLQISISNQGQLFYLNSESQEQQVSVQEFFELVNALAPTQVVEIHADQLTPAVYLLDVNRIVQNADRNAVFSIKRV